ncbi:unnamed protein product [Cuscuta europaea]|uniref:Uncharacterized protein n=1 Tax=Cuscuta europaea TaxID=41803 RepID=A0A9P0Z0C3_CUSEU|nr:unnamed protein product [Cuscuta europaea]
MDGALTLLLELTCAGGYHSSESAEICGRKDGAVGNINQTGDSFWFRVHMFFCQKANAIVRTEEAVESGFKLPIISVLYGRGVCEKQMQPLEVDPIQWMWYFK